MSLNLAFGDFRSPVHLLKVLTDFATAAQEHGLDIISRDITFGISEKRPNEMRYHGIITCYLGHEDEAFYAPVLLTLKVWWEDSLEQALDRLHVRSMAPSVLDSKDDDSVPTTVSLLAIYDVGPDKAWRMEDIPAIGHALMTVHTALPTVITEAHREWFVTVPAIYEAGRCGIGILNIEQPMKLHVEDLVDSSLRSSAARAIMSHIHIVMQRLSAEIIIPSTRYEHKNMDNV